MEHPVRQATDAAAAAVTLATIAQWLPPIASLLTIIWYLVRFWQLWKERKGK